MAKTITELLNEKLAEKQRQSPPPSFNLPQQRGTAVMEPPDLVGPPASLAGPEVMRRSQTAFPQADPKMLAQINAMDFDAPQPVGPTSDVRMRMGAAPKTAAELMPLGGSLGAGAGMDLIGKPLGAIEAGRRTWDTVKTIGQGISEMVLPTNPYTREESDAMADELEQRLLWQAKYVGTLGGMIGPKGMRDSLMAEAESFRGFGPATVAAAGDMEKLALEWGLVYPALFKAAGLAGTALSQIPRIKQGADALKAAGGIKAMATKYPRLVNSVGKISGAALKGGVVGATKAGAEVIGKDMSPGGAIRHIGTNAAMLAGVAAAFQVAGQIDTARWVKQYRNSLLDAHRSHYDLLLGHVDHMNPGPAKGRAIKGLGSHKIRDLKAIDTKVARAEAELRGIKANKLYQTGQESFETPEVAANRAIESLKIGLGKSRPFIEMPTTRAGEAVEAIRGVARTPRAPVPRQAPGTQKPPSAAQVGLAPGKVSAVPPVGVSPADQADFAEKAKAAEAVGGMEQINKLVPGMSVEQMQGTVAAMRKQLAILQSDEAQTGEKKKQVQELIAEIDALEHDIGQKGGIGAIGPGVSIAERQAAKKPPEPPVSGREEAPVPEPPLKPPVDQLPTEKQEAVPKAAESEVKRLSEMTKEEAIVHILKREADTLREQGKRVIADNFERAAKDFTDPVLKPDVRKGMRMQIERAEAEYEWAIEQVKEAQPAPKAAEGEKVDVEWDKRKRVLRDREAKKIRENEIYKLGLEGQQRQKDIFGYGKIQFPKEFQGEIDKAIGDFPHLKFRISTELTFAGKHYDEALEEIGDPLMDIGEFLDRMGRATKTPKTGVLSSEALEFMATSNDVDAVLAAAKYEMLLERDLTADEMNNMIREIASEWPEMPEEAIQSYFVETEDVRKGKKRVPKEVLGKTTTRKRPGVETGVFGQEVITPISGEQGAFFEKKDFKSPEPDVEGQKKFPPKPAEGETRTSLGAAGFGFTTMNPALARAGKLAAKNKRDYYVVQGETGKYGVRDKVPPKGNYTTVKPSGEETFIKQASVQAEDSFDYGEQVKRQEKFDSKLDEFKAKLKQKNVDVKAIQDELFNMVKASGMSPAKVKSVVGLLRNIGPQRSTKTNLKVLMKAIARASDYTKQENARLLRRAILKTLKKTPPTKVHGRPKGKYIPEVQTRLDFIRRNILRTRESVLSEMASNLNKVQKGDMLPVDMLEANSLLNLVGIKGMSGKDMLNSLEQIGLLMSQGKLIHDEKIAEIKERRDRIKERVVNILTGGKGFKEGAATLPEGDIEVKPSAINKLNRFSSAWDNIMDYLSRFDITSKPYESDISKLGDLVHLAEHDEAKGIETEILKVHNAFMEIFKTKNNHEMWKIIHELNKQNIELGIFTNAIEEKIHLKNLSKEQLIKKYMEMQDPTLEETFTGGTTEGGVNYGMHWTQEMRQAVVDNLSETEKAWADWQLKHYQEYYDSINEVYKEHFFVDLPHNLYYSPINRMAEQEMAEEMLLFKEVIRYASVTNPSLISRVKSVLPLSWTKADKVLMNHITRMEHFKHWAASMNELRSIFGDKEVRTAIRQYHGNHILKRIDVELDQFAKGGIDQMLVNNWVDRLRRNFTTAALARPAIAFKQVPSALSYTTEMPFGAFIKGVNEFWLHPIRNTRQLMQLSPTFKESVGGGYERDVRLAMHRGADTTLSRHKGFREWLFMHIRLGDYIARGPGQYAKWKYEQKSGKSSEEAMRAAEKTTGRTQPGWKLSQLSAPQKGGSLWKLFTMFQTQPIRYYNIAVDNARNIRYGRGSRTKALANLALIWVILPMIFNWISDAFQWKKKHQMVAVALGPFGYIPIAGKLITNIALAFVGEAYGTQLSPIQSIPERFKRAASATRRLFKNRGDSTKDTTVEDAIKLTEELAEGVGYVGGLPTPYLVQAERAVRTWGETKKGRIPGWRRHPATELVYSPYSLKAGEKLKGMTTMELGKEIDTNTTNKGIAHKGKLKYVQQLWTELRRRNKQTEK